MNVCMLESTLTSSSQLFYFIEDAPLLCILEDFLPQLDEFFIEQESNLDFTPDIDTSMQEIVGGSKHRGSKGVLEGVEIGKKGVETGKKEVETGKVERLEKGEEEVFAEEGEEVKFKGRGVEGSLASVDEQYVHALEIYCLLKQRLLDMRHSWRLVIKEALLDHGQHTGTYLAMEDWEGDHGKHAGTCLVQ